MSEAIRPVSKISIPSTTAVVPGSRTLAEETLRGAGALEDADERYTQALADLIFQRSEVALDQGRVEDACEEILKTATSLGAAEMRRIAREVGSSIATYDDARLGILHESVVRTFRRNLPDMTRTLLDRYDRSRAVSYSGTLSDLADAVARRVLARPAVSSDLRTNLELCLAASRELTSAEMAQAAEEARFASPLSEAVIDEVGELVRDRISRRFDVLGRARLASLDEEKREIEDDVSILDTFHDARKMMRAGVALWEKTYKKGATDEEAESEAAVQASGALAAMRPTARDWFRRIATTEKGEDDSGRILRDHLWWCAKWAHFAFPQIMTSHTYAAALMCTDVYRDALDDLLVQWTAFSILVPDRMLPLFSAEDLDSEGRQAYIARLHVSTAQERSRVVGISSQGVVAFDVRAGTFADVLIDRFGEGDEPDPLEARIARATRLALRLVAGLLLAMQHTDNFKEKRVGGVHAKGRKREDPEHRVVVVGTPSRSTPVRPSRSTSTAAATGEGAVRRRSRSSCEDIRKGRSSA